MQPLKDYWIPKIQDVTEFKYIATAEQPEIDALNGEVSSFVDECCIKTATDNGLTRFENMLGLAHGINLEERRTNILLNLNASIPFTEKYLRSLLDSMLGEESYTLKVADYVMNLNILAQKSNLLNLFRSDLRKKIPANIGLTVSLLDNIDGHIYVGAYIRNAKTITVKMDRPTIIASGETSILGTAKLGEWILGKEN